MKAGKKLSIASSPGSTSPKHIGPTDILQGKQMNVVVSRKRKSEEKFDQRGNSSENTMSVEPIKKARTSKQLEKGGKIAGLSSDTESAESESEQHGGKSLTGQIKGIKEVA